MYTDEQFSTIEMALDLSLKRILDDYPKALAIRWVGKIKDDTIRVCFQNPSSNQLAEPSEDLFKTIVCDVSFEDNGNVSVEYAL